MKRFTKVCAILLLSGAPASAHLHLPPPGPMHPCVNDERRYCDDVVPGMGRLFACLDEHKAQLASACRTQLQGIEDMHAHVEAIKAKLQAERIAAGKKPDPLLNPAPIGQMFNPNSKTVTYHRRAAPPPAVKPATAGSTKPTTPASGSAQNKPAPAVQTPQTTPQNSQTGGH